ncbi:MAG: acyl carrier protein [Opitutales bacterium]|nr:acyl carrier protein [Opitutales bacterium]
MNKENLIEKLKQSIIQTLNLVGVSPSDIDSDTPLFDADGLGLDSVDALELVVMIEREYNITVDDKDEAKTIFSSLSALADYIIAHK